MKILLFGGNGQVGWELQRSLATLGELAAPASAEADFNQPERVRACVSRFQPDIIVNAAAYTAVDKAESEPETAHRINADTVGVLAEEAHRLQAWLVHYSTDYVFDGRKAAPYTEQDATHPLSAYGRSKLDGEHLIRQVCPRHLILRTSWVYAARGANFARTMLRLAREREQLNVVADQHGAPTSAELIADVSALALYRILGNAASDKLAGTYHLAAGGSTTWHGYAQTVLALAQSSGAALKAGPAQVHPIATEAYPLPAPRPKNSRLDTTKLTSSFGLHLPDWRIHVRRLVVELTAQGPT
jgi:dTDP-4-dehydrorhamnose reductase